MIKYVLILFAYVSFLSTFLFPQNNDSLLTPTNLKEEIEDEEESFRMFEGKYISKITINVIDLAGPNINDTNGKDTGFFGKLGEMLHVKTKDWVVANNLLFKVGDIVVPSEFSESERLIRNSNYALDAKITVIPSPTNPDSVEVKVAAKDKWTISPKVSYNAQHNNYYFGFKDDNILGLGHLIDATATYDESKMIGMGFDLKYSAINVASTFINITSNYEKNKKVDFKELSFERPLYSTEASWIGGLHIQWEKDLLLYPDSIQGFSTVLYRNAVQDLWGGKIIRLNNEFTGKLRIGISGRIANTNYRFDESALPQFKQLFSNNTLYLLSLGFIKRSYYKDNLVDGFGHTEDIPLGSMLVLTSGIQKIYNTDRKYYGIEAIVARRIYEIGYVQLRGAYGGFKKKDKWEQNISSFNLIYHSRLLGSSIWKYRMFVNTDYLMGFNRFEGEMIYLDSENKLRGFSDRMLYGQKKLTLNVESRVYSPFKPLGFLITGVLFADYGMIADKGNLFNSKLYQSYGTGIRFTNEAINKANFEVSLVFNPIYVGKKSNFSIIFSSSLVLGFKEFSLSKPNILEYNKM